MNAAMGLLDAINAAYVKATAIEVVVHLVAAAAEGLGDAIDKGVDVEEFAAALAERSWSVVDAALGLISDPRLQQLTLAYRRCSIPAFFEKRSTGNGSTSKFAALELVAASRKPVAAVRALRADPPSQKSRRRNAG